MQLKLTKPLAFFDLETTGVNVATDRIIEICIIKVMPDGTKEKLEQRVNPEIPIPAASSMVHGIYDHDVANMPTFKKIGKTIANFIGNSDLAGYNSNKFDIPILVEEFLRAEIDFDIENRKTIDVQNIFHLMEQRTLKAAYKFYCNKEIINAHSAEADVSATYEVLMAQLEKYKDAEFEDKNGVKSKPVQNDVKMLHDFTNINRNVDLAGRIIYNDKGIEVFNFGKHAGKAVSEVLKNEPSYYAWMINGDFPLYTKKVLTALKLRDFNK
ncbi:MAG: exonuclease domain-containing protein [Bacteroidota bacterium]